MWIQRYGRTESVYRTKTETKGTTNQRAQICTSGPPKFTDCPSKTSSQGGTSDAQILAIDIFALACPVIFIVS
ncbi:hypothetical protein GBAR_LOCUS6869, partial [Geodia barretti]